MGRNILVVGAGFAGAVYARILAEAGCSVQIIDKRPHIGGNAFDYVDDNGIRVHAYGPHLFHTKNSRVIEWIKQFGSFVPYTHKVRALLPSGRLVPMPVNLDTINGVFGTHFETAEETRAHLGRIAIRCDVPRNSAEYLNSQIGRELTDLFFRPYTKKMWGFDLEDMAPDVVKRIPIRTDRTDTYFADDDIQIMPRDGYTSLFERMFEHPNIRVATAAAFDTALQNDYDFTFNSMPIDEYFGFQLGELPYRSIRFHARSVAAQGEQDFSVTNFTDTGIFTRETAWHVLPHHIMRETGRRTLTREEPCDYRDNGMERYYPVKTADGVYQTLYEAYRDLAAGCKNISFIGRCGTYQYLDMDQVINQSLAGAHKWLESWP